MKSIYLIFIFVFIGCATSNNVKSKRQTLKVINIEEYNSVYCMEVKNNINETILVLSFKKTLPKNSYLSSVVDKIKVGENYNLELVSFRPQVSTMQELGAFIIVKSDTLRKAASYKEIPKTFVAQNTYGLNLYSVNNKSE